MSEQWKVKVYGEPSEYTCIKCGRVFVSYGKPEHPLCLVCLCEHLSEKTGIAFIIERLEKLRR